MSVGQVVSTAGGKAVVSLDGGGTAELSSLTFKNPEIATVYDAAATHGTNAARALVEGYDDKLPADKYVKAANHYITVGEIGRAKEEISDGELGRMIKSKVTRESLFLAGQRDAASAHAQLGGTRGTEPQATAALTSAPEAESVPASVPKSTVPELSSNSPETAENGVDPKGENGYDENNNDKMSNKEAYSSKIHLENINDYISGNKSFDDVINDYAKLYSKKVNDNRQWKWEGDMPNGGNLTTGQKARIKAKAVENGDIPNINIKKVDGRSYADFKGAGVVKKALPLPENMWRLTDNAQFNWLDEQMENHMDGYTWHHSEIPGEMQLVPFGIHNVTYHNGGRSAGMWANAPR